MATKKGTAAGKSVSAKKTAGKKSASRQASSKSPGAKKAAAGGAANKRAAKGSGQAGNYTDPALREKIKREVVAGDKGGRAGQWSARKAQLVAHEYEAQGGGYKHARDEAQQSLKDWGDEHWQTADGKQAIQGEETHRYLPGEAWKELAPEEKKATDSKKVAGSKDGRQFVANTPAASKARKHAAKHTG